MNIPLNIDWQQIFLHLFNFTILTAGLYFLLYKPVKDFMDKRIAYYQEMDRKAEEKLSEAEACRADCSRELHNIEEKIAKREEESARTRMLASENELKKAREQAEEIIRNAKTEAKQEHEKIIEDAKKEVADLVTIAAEKLLLKSENSEVFDQFLLSAEGSALDE